MKIFSQGFLFMNSIYLLVTVPMIVFSYQIMMTIGIPEEESLIASIILKKLIPCLALRTINEFLKTICNSQGVERIFGQVGIFNITFSTILNWYLITKLDSHVMGFIIANTVYEIMNFILCLYAMTLTMEGTTGFSQFLNSLADFPEFMWDTLKFNISCSCEYVAYQIITYFFAISQSIEVVAAFTACVNTFELVYLLGQAFACIGRTRLNLLVGLGDNNAAKHYYIFFCLCIVITGGFISILGYIFINNIAAFYANSTKEITHLFKVFFRIYLFDIPWELMMNTSLIGLKTIGKINTLVILNLLILCLLYPAICFFFYKFSAPPAWYYIFQVLFVVTLNVVCLSMVIFTKWSIIQLRGEAQQIDVHRSRQTIFAVRETKPTPTSLILSSERGNRIQLSVEVAK